MSEEDNENPMTEEEQRNYGALVTGYAASPGFILGYNTVLRSPLAQTVEAADRQFRQTEQVPLTSLDLYEYFIALEPQQIEQLAKALFVEGYITFTNNVAESLPLKVFLNFSGPVAITSSICFASKLVSPHKRSLRVSRCRFFASSLRSFNDLPTFSLSNWPTSSQTH